MALFGIDVSSAQAGMDTSVVPADYVITKVTGGVGYVNPYADAQIRGAKQGGKRTAIYHYVGDGNPGTAAQEAAWFVQNSLGYLDGTNVVVMDWEAGGNPNVTDSGYAQRFVDAVLNASGIQPVGYADIAHIQYLLPAYNAGMPVWAAGYTLGYTPIYGYSVPQGPLGNLYGIAPIMWQFTSSGQLPTWSGNLDLNIFYSDGAAWDALAAKHGVVTQGTPTGSGDEMSMTKAERDVLIAELMTHPVTQPDGVVTNLEVTIAEMRGHVTGTIAVIQGVANALLDMPINNASGGSTSLRQMISWNDAHVNALADDIAKVTGTDPSVVVKAVKDALAAGVKVTVTAGP